MAPPARDSSETRELLRQVEEGSRAAVEELLARHRECLRRFIEVRLDPKLRGRVDASDVVQETQLEAFRRLPDFLARRPMPFRLWLFRTAHERLLKVRRRHLSARKRAVGREISLSEESSIVLARGILRPDTAPGQRLDHQEIARRVHQALNQMSELDQEILLMRNFEGLSNQEVAQVLGIEPATASQRFGRALLRLRKMLLAGGMEPEG